MLPTQVFLDADFYRDRAAEKGLHPDLLEPDRAAEAPLHLYWSRPDVPRFTPTSVAAGPVVLVRCQQAAWIAACPLCGLGAQYASRTDLRYFCLHCLNEDAAGAWLPVEWPTDPADIETVLRPRQTKNANWVHGETVAALIAENHAHGIGA